MVNVGSLFCGCGGSDLGLLGDFIFIGKKYKKLDTKVVFALDNDPKAVETYNFNFKHPAIVKDIREVSVDEIPALDLLIGGFPCQSYSTVNPTKNPFDDRGKLYLEMGRIIGAKKPKVFIAENVKGMALLKNGYILKAVIKEFSDYGYDINYAILNAADYGVPQKRERVLIVGVRKDLNKTFKFPESIHSKEGKDGKKPWVALNKIIDSLNDVDPKYYFSEKAVQGMKNAKNNMKRGLAQNLLEPCLTVTSHLAKVSLNSRDPVLLVNEKLEKYRRFTPREVARIQSFPDTFEFVGSESSAYKQIGNAIAPVMMWYIANAIMKQIFNK